ncbi:YbaB/EbfC family nucleoid-associated protein [Nocardia sp. XZ_19_385]|uniref:YbaB/EbfC family nucleoid-associated protein n=1 Tax=Nocardia sp. XZ_19_385 TaxID=2769488 RepID=UPI00188DEC9E|nr:YbaB/EbfC family nucleoid-associated protein [Nocardia sp. XZ_19_385]
MNSFEQDRLRARTDALQGQVDTMLSTYEQQLRDIANARDALAASTSEGWSDDNMIRVTTNAAGVPVEVFVDPGAFKRSTPEQLAASFLQASQVAAHSAKSAMDTLLAPVTAAAAEFTPPEQFYEELPFIGEPIGDILPSPPEPAAVAPAPEPLLPADDEDEGPHWKGLGANHGW